MKFSEVTTLQSFVDWYFKTYPNVSSMIPEDAETFRTDDASAICTFRQGQYQVELYLLDNVYGVVSHAHPGIEVIQVALAFPGVPRGTVLNSIKGLESHGSGNWSSRNHVPTPGTILAFQKWHPSLRPSTVAVQWMGPTVGPLHRALIRRFRPDAKIDSNGYATFTADELALLTDT